MPPPMPPPWPLRRRPFRSRSRRLFHRTQCDDSCPDHCRRHQGRCTRAHRRHSLRTRAHCRHSLHAEQRIHLNRQRQRCSHRWKHPVVEPVALAGYSPPNTCAGTLGNIRLPRRQREMRTEDWRADAPAPCPPWHRSTAPRTGQAFRCDQPFRDRVGVLCSWLPSRRSSCRTRCMMSLCCGVGQAVGCRRQCDASVMNMSPRYFCDSYWCISGCNR